MFKPIDLLNIYLNTSFVGKMVLSPQRLCVFEYSPEFIATGFSISPFYLPLKSGVFTARSEPFNGLFGIFNDSLPDGWGNLLIDRYFTSKGMNPGVLSVLDRLSIVGSSGMGALAYLPDNHIKANGDISEIGLLAIEVSKVLSEIDYDTSIDILAEKSGSSGGARPKHFHSYGQDTKPASDCNEGGLLNLCPVLMFWHQYFKYQLLRQVPFLPFLVGLVS
jgi:serine/threonine-protein kinase HipA